MKIKSILILSTMLFTLITLAVFMLLLSPPTHASSGGDWYVDVNSGDDGNDCLTTGTACATIAETINRANNGDTIHIAAGFYAENLNFNGKDLSFMGAGAGETVVDGGGTNRVFSGFNTDLFLGDMTIQNGFTSSSSGGAGVWVDGRLTANNIIVRHNQATAVDAQGGGIRVYGLGLGRALTMTNSLLTHNSSDRGAGLTADLTYAYLENVAIVNNIANQPTFGAFYQRGNGATLVNVTISSNTGDGFHLSNFGAFTITNSTIADNSGFGLSTFAGGVWENTLLAANNGAGVNCSFPQPLWVVSLGANLEDGDGCDFDAPTDQINTNPQIGALSNNGGNTQTHLLLAGSPAIDTGNDGNCPATDQRGVARPQDGNGNSTAVCDIGAFEVAHIALTAVTVSGADNGLINSNYAFQAAIEPAIASQPVTYTWTATGQTAVVQTSGITDSVTFNWPDAGNKTVNVSAGNGLGQAMASHQINIQVGEQALTSVTINGSTAGVGDEDYTFTANAAPNDATVPITYTWQIVGQTDVVHVGDTSDSVTVSWAMDGVYTVTVTAVNAVNSVSDSHTITLSGLYVNAHTGDDSNDCQSTATACATIGEAVSRAGDGTFIRIAAGTYPETVVITQSLHLIGAGANVTKWDGSDLGTPLYLSDGTVNSFMASLSGMTIQNSLERGIYNEENLTIHDSVIENNEDGGIYNTNILSMTNSTIQNNSTDNSGGGLFNGGTARLLNVTVSGNHSDNSSGIHGQSGSTYLTNVTVSGNTGTAAIISSSGGSVFILNSTIANNEGGGTSNFATMSVQNTILADNGLTNCWSTMTSLGHNIEDNDDCGLNQTGDITNTAPLLEPLTNNGGHTLTHLLQEDSPAINAGNNAACPATDQRGVARPVNSVCDMGAVEIGIDVIHMLYLPLIVR